MPQILGPLNSHAVYEGLKSGVHPGLMVWLFYQKSNEAYLCESVRLCVYTHGLRRCSGMVCVRTHTLRM